MIVKPSGCSGGGKPQNAATDEGGHCRVLRVTADKRSLGHDNGQSQEKLQQARESGGGGVGGT